MSTNIIAFESMDASAYGFDFSINQAAEEFASVRFPSISAKAGRFHLKRDGEKTLIQRPKANKSDPDEPASYLDIVVLDVQKAKSYYAAGYVEGDAEKPDCMSDDGVNPNASVANKQCSNCALCPHNAWGSGRNDKGESTKGKACSDVLRLAVATADNLGDPMMFKVPPASLGNFGEMSKFLTSKRLVVNAVVTRITFDADKTGVLLFKAIGGLDANSYREALKMKDTSIVKQITGKTYMDNAPSAPALAAPAKPAIDTDAAKAGFAGAKLAALNAEAAASAEAEAKAADVAKKAAAAKAKKLAAAKAALAALEAEGDAEEVVETQKAAEPAVQKTTTVASSDNFSSELADLLA